MHYKVTHVTQYEYNDTVGLSYNEARLMPRNCVNQQVISSTLNVEPYAADFRIREDFFGNRVAYFSIQQPHHVFTVTAVSEVQLMGNTSQLDFYQGFAWETVREMLSQQHSHYLKQASDLIEARQYTLDSPLIETSLQLAEYAKPSFTQGRSVTDTVNDLMQRIYRDFTFDPDFTTLATPLASVLEHRRGVCQDFAHLAIGCLRSQGLAARYVSGYIETLPPQGEAKLVGADASHAWFSVYIPEQGWLDFDPTNNIIPNTQHITLGWGRDYGDIAPLKGVIFGGQNHELEVSVQVECLTN
ncbi:transglutaminase family protein [Methylotenera sp.]|uniref:transglutaminase family protein n=1 Tax=Methylotenera sp. TaxID=2051956 RepID=UPI0027304847|nr:transglutaminase family protein [Methylotenera sp.]MDP2229335.1 transglutaminase family protein [Methylotenera sp.]MDP3142002.1 transglutaminase family protein [Methylotenera sp.]